MTMHDSTIFGQEIQPPPDRAATPIKLVAVDIDGTLLTSKKQIRIRTIQAINAAARKGVRVVLASARPPRTTREIYGHLGLDTPQINYNGALIYDMQHRRVVFHRPLPAQLARRIMTCARELHPHVCIDVEITDRWFTDRVNPYLTTATSEMHEPDHIGPIDEWLHEPVTKLMLLADPQELPSLRDAIAEQFRDHVRMIVADSHLIQIVHPDVDKAVALKKITDQFNIDAGEVLAIGDAPNDVGMLKWAGIGVAVENAWPSARDAADHIMPSNDDDGVYCAFEKFVL